MWSFVSNAIDRMIDFPVEVVSLFFSRAEKMGANLVVYQQNENTYAPLKKVFTNLISYLLPDNTISETSGIAEITKAVFQQLTSSITMIPDFLSNLNKKGEQAFLFIGTGESEPQEIICPWDYIYCHKATLARKFSEASPDQYAKILQNYLGQYNAGEICHDIYNNYLSDPNVLAALTATAAVGAITYCYYQHNQNQTEKKEAEEWDLKLSDLLEEIVIENK